MRFISGRFIGALLALSVTAAAPAVANAQGFGGRAGISVNPDQFYIGGHYESTALVEALHFKPNIELGFGEDLTTVGFNFEFVYKFPLETPWTLYAGAGPALNIYKFDDDSDSEGGLNILFGAEVSQGLFFEVKVGALDSPDLKFGVGYTWR